MKPRSNNPKLKLVPTLDKEGWLQYGEKNKLDRLLAYFFTSEASQSTLYYGTIPTYQSIAANNIEDITTLREQLETNVTEYLRKYLESVNVEVYVTTVDGIIKDIHELEAENAVGIKMNIQYYDNDKFVVFEKNVIYKEGIFNYVLDKFNTGFSISEDYRDPR